MDINIKTSLIRRKQEMYEFYYRGFGNRIKRKRLELKLTQQKLAHGICSNTYISKIENNKVVVNREHLYLLMEKMGLPTENIGFPEEMVEFLLRSIRYFFFKDIENYTELYKEIEKYNFGILLYIVRFGYYILTEDKFNASNIYDDMYRYLNLLEDFGFATFLIFSGFYNIMMNDYQNARMVLNSSKEKIQNNEMLLGLYNYLKFKTYGNLHLFNKAKEGLVIAQEIFINYSNIKRVCDIFVDKNIFSVYEGENEDIKFHTDHLKSLSYNERNAYLITLAYKENKPYKYLRHLHKDGDYYLTGKYILARECFKNNKMKEYEEIKKCINDMHYSKNAELDYCKLLKLHESKEWIFMKDYLINHVLPFAVKRQNLYLIKEILKQISNILKEKKRYKDALCYLEKIDQYKHKFQKSNSITA
ncbi:helix-turn-helix domain-containing protein [Candidatus Izemoplasma sp. B36]|uniref:helix-turn-helix domain-containing protein n=1 Tax=Candidatus Izemoplasma sp. B36 TaxID=3242468 RepID=UPI003557B29E